MPQRATQPRDRLRSKASRVASVFLFSLLLCAHLCVFLPTFSAQESEEEVVANLAAGRVVVYVAKDGIVIGAHASSNEAQSRPPLFAPLSSHRIAILLGAVEWLQPASGRPPVRLDRELLSLFGQIAGPKRLEQEHANDIEEIGMGLLERLRNLAQQLHRKLDLRPEEPLVELLLVGYVEDYGPEVWTLKYRIAQDLLRGDYYRTRVLRPVYEQLYPPEKGQPRTLVEIRYPPEEPGPALLDLVRSDDPRIARLRTADPQTARATEKLVRGESHHALADDATQLLRGALGVLAPPDLEQVVALIRQERGLEWVLAPAEAPAKAEQAQPREPGAPTLRKKPP